MRPKVKTVRRSAEVLSGAKATFVSLVDAGANETPFTEIKSKNGAKGMKKKLTAAKKSHKPLSSKKGKAETKAKLEKAISHFEYDVAEFATEEDVRKHMDASDWEGEYTVEQKGDIFVVTPDELEGIELSNVTKVDTDDDGVAAYIGMKPVDVLAEAAKAVKAADGEEAEDDGEEAEDGEGADEECDDDGEEGDDDDDLEKPIAQLSDKKPAKAKKAAAKPKTTLSKRDAFLAKRKEEKAAAKAEQKFDYWECYCSGENQFAQLMKDAMSDGVPPGVNELTYVLNQSVANILGDSELTTEEKAAQLTESATSFAETVAKLDGLFQEIVEKSVEEVVTEETVEAANHFIEIYGDFLNGETLAPAASAKKVQKSSKGGDKSPVIDYSGIQKAVGDLISPLAEKVEKLASRAPLSKSQSVDDTDNGDTNKQTAKKKSVDDDAQYMRDKATKSFLG